MDDVNSKLPCMITVTKPTSSQVPCDIHIFHEESNVNIEPMKLEMEMAETRKDYDMSPTIYDEDHTRQFTECIDSYNVEEGSKIIS